MDRLNIRNLIDDDAYKYNVLEPILQEINRNISISDEEKRDNQSVLGVVDIIIEKMTTLDETFRKLYRHNMYAGSTYDNLKISKPDEFDLDVVLAIPERMKPILSQSSTPGFVEIQLGNFNAKQESNTEFRKMVKFMDYQNYLIPTSFRSWFEGLIKRATDEISREYNFTVHKSGPAFTLVVDYSGKVVFVDLVPSFVFGTKYWPQSPFRQNFTRRPEFLIIPKDPPNRITSYIARSFRLSFNEQERELMNGKNRLKDAIRLLKRLRDVQGQSEIASYYIKTIILWMAEYLDNSFWQKSLSYVFMNALKVYQIHLENCEIPYFWDKRFNLLTHKSPITYFNSGKRIQRIIKDIDRNLGSKDELINLMFKYFGVLNRAEVLESINHNINNESTCILL